MEELSFTTVDKSSWPSGPWNEEPDKLQFMTAAGLPGLIVRGPIGALCGYIGVAEPHPLFGVDYNGCPKYCGGDRYALEGEMQCNDESPESLFTVHGGLTFSDFCQPGEERRGICHVPDVSAGEPERVWWFGFDCAHCGDVTPKHDFNFDVFAVYRDLAYVRREVESLAAQLAKVAA